jgi:NADPH:quinone reductase-like Zn-dependent oxidoreductase
MRVAGDVFTERGTTRTDMQRAKEAARHACRHHPPGAADVLTLEDVPVPEPGLNQVAIDVM